MSLDPRLHAVRAAYADVARLESELSTQRQKESRLRRRAVDARARADELEARISRAAVEAVMADT